MHCGQADAGQQRRHQHSDRERNNDRMTKPHGHLAALGTAPGFVGSRGVWFSGRVRDLMKCLKLDMKCLKLDRGELDGLFKTNRAMW